MAFSTTYRGRDEGKAAGTAYLLVFDEGRQDLERDMDACALPAPNIMGGLLLEEGADFGEFVRASRGVIEQICQFGAVGLDVCRSVLGQARIAFEDEKLVLRAELSTHRVEMARQMRVRHACGQPLLAAAKRPCDMAKHVQVDSAPSSIENSQLVVSCVDEDVGWNPRLLELRRSRESLISQYVSLTLLDPCGVGLLETRKLTGHMRP